MMWMAACAVVICGVQEGSDPAERFRERYRQVLHEGQPSSGADIYPLIEETAKHLNDMMKEFVSAEFPGVNAAETDLQALTREGATEEQRRVARAFLKEALESDLTQKTAAVARAVRLDRPMNDALLLQQKLPWLGYARQIARFQAGRMMVLLGSGDIEGWFTAFDETMRLGTQVSGEPTLISAMVGIAIQSLALDAGRRLLASAHATEGNVARLKRAVEKHAMPRFEHAIAGERILGEDTLDYVYATGPDGMQQIGGLGGGPAPKRPVRHAIAAGQALGPGMPSYEEHLRLLNQAYDAALALSRLPAKERRGNPEQQKIAAALEKSLLATMLLPAIDRSLGAWDQLAAELTGVLVQCRLELHHARHGSYPESLAALGVDAGSTRDPYTGGSIGYLPPSRGPFAGGRSYVLYAAGVDGVDDGGKVDFTEPHSANKRDARGIDLLLNRHVRP